MIPDDSGDDSGAGFYQIKGRQLKEPHKIEKKSSRHILVRKARTCSNKVRYRELEQIKKALRHWPDQRMYFCHYCNGWHLTRQVDRIHPSSPQGTDEVKLLLFELRTRFITAGIDGDHRWIVDSNANPINLVTKFLVVQTGTEPNIQPSIQPLGSGVCVEFFLPEKEQTIWLSFAGGKWDSVQL